VSALAPYPPTESTEAPAPTERVSVHIDRGLDPLAAMTHEDRIRLFIRVLCGLVAYGEPADAATPASGPGARPARPVPSHRAPRARRA
jgi:hypothetical protein